MDEDEIQRQIWLEEKQERHRELWIGVKRAFFERCANENNWCLNRAERFFYLMKCLICIALFRRWKPKYGDYPDVVDVSTIYARQLYAGWEACWLQVGYGILSGWFYQVERDGDWWM